MSNVIVKENETLDSALRRFKRSCAKAGIQQEIRKREHYEKPSVKRKKKHELKKLRNSKTQGMSGIYIQAAEQISIQVPLSEQWMDEPAYYDEASLVKAQNPSFRDYMAANEARRMGNIMKRALATTLKLLSETGVEHPDAIITGTCLGSLDYTERFLDSIVENNEQTVSPTYFMQSTHNTVGSALAIYTKTHGYNTTYSHSGTSFDLTLLDAWMQMQLGKISTALVGGHDEMTDHEPLAIRGTHGEQCLHLGGCWRNIMQIECSQLLTLQQCFCEFLPSQVVVVTILMPYPMVCEQHLLHLFLLSSFHLCLL